MICYIQYAAYHMQYRNIQLNLGFFYKLAIQIKIRFYFFGSCSMAIVIRQVNNSEITFEGNFQPLHFFNDVNPNQRIVIFWLLMTVYPCFLRQSHVQIELMPLELKNSFLKKSCRCYNAFLPEWNIMCYEVKGYIDIGDECWRPNVLVTSSRCWWPIQDVEDRLNTLEISPT